MAVRLVPLLLALALGACGGGGTKTAERTVDDQEVEQGIKAELSTSSAKVTKASCPSDVPVEKGSTFTCSVTFSNGATGKVTVTQEAARRYTYTLKAGSVQVPGSEVESQIRKSLSAQGVQNATVTCPQTIIVKVGTTVTCDVSGASGVASGTVTYTFSSAEGTVDSSSVKTG
jgi:hypothetical protein